MKKLSNIAILIAFLVCMPSHAADRAKIGLVLSGGGARGAAHIGVLKELERQRIPIDYIAGTSIGAFMGGLYAAGYNTDDIETIVKGIDWEDIFQDQPNRKYATIRRKFEDDLFQINREAGIKDGRLRLPSGLIQGQKLQLFLDRQFLQTSSIEHFDNLPIPFRAVATDLATGEAVVLEDGSLSMAIRASMSVPSAFATVKHQGRILIDGGISNNLPVDVVRRMGADVVIAVDIGTPLRSEGELETLVDVSVQLTNLMVQNTMKSQIAKLNDSDILITPELGTFSSADFSNAIEIISSGITAAKAVASRLSQYSTDVAATATAGQSQYVSSSQPAIITSIRINNNSDLDDEFIRSRLIQKVGNELDFDRLESDIGVIYGLGYFESVNYEIIKEPESTVLQINAVEKPWGPGYLQFGVSYNSDLGDNNDLTGTIGYTVMPLNSRNGEWRSLLKLGEDPGLATEIYQPIAIDSPYFVNASLSFTNKLFNTFDDGRKISETRSKQFGGSLAAGREIETWGDVRLGLRRFNAKNDLNIGQSQNATEDEDGGGVFALARVDTLDNAFFPSDGFRGRFQWSSSRSELGADSEFNQLQLDGLNVSSWNEHTLFFGAKYYSTVDGESAIQNRFRLGGLFNLPGFVTNELSGANLYLIRSAYQRKIRGLFGTDPFAGFTLQYGDVFQDIDDMSFSDGIYAGGIWLGWDSYLGPIFLGYGRADTGDQSLYLNLGFKL